VAADPARRPGRRALRQQLEQRREADLRVHQHNGSNAPTVWGIAAE
jgi:hypothetical protein